jgi:hypothetical protein
LVPEATSENNVVLAPEIIRRRPLWREEERKISTEAAWDRLRREPALPLLLKRTDLLPTFRAGLEKSPDSLWVYYAKPDKKLFTRENAAGLSPVIAPDHFLYDTTKARDDGVWPVSEIAPENLEQHGWPQNETGPAAKATIQAIQKTIRNSPHFPVMPLDDVLWRSIQAGVRENRWVLVLTEANLAIGGKEMAEWPGTPRIDDRTELWTYQAALDAGIYPRPISDSGNGNEPPLTPENIKIHCWPGGKDQVSAEELARNCRNIWPNLSHPQLAEQIRSGVAAGVWGGWEKNPEETFYLREDQPPAGSAADRWVLVAPDTALARNLEPLRPGKGPQPVEHAGTPREALTHVWEDLAGQPNLAVSELSLTVSSRDALDNTLRSTWADRPAAASARAEVMATGQREAGGRTESVQLSFEGRFEEIPAFLAPVWPFQSQGNLDVTVTVRLTFDPPVPLNDPALETYKTAVVGANQGSLEARLVPARKRKEETP